MPKTVGELARALDQHPNTVREHLDALVEGGHALRDVASARGRGRPAHRYRSAFADGLDSPFSYVGLVSALAEHLEESTPDSRSAALRAGRSWGRRVGSATAGGPGPQRSADRAPVASSGPALLSVLDRLGFDPQPVGRSRDGAPPPTTAGPGDELGASPEDVVLRACPVLDVARRHTTVVCAVHEGMVQGILESLGSSTGASLRPFADPGGCVLRLTGQGASR